MIRFCFFLIWLLVFSLNLLAETPKMIMQKHEKEIIALIQQKERDKSKIQLIDKEIVKVMNRLIDYPELGKRALADAWLKTKPAEQKEYLYLLQALIEKNYLTKANLESTRSYSVTWKKEQPKGEEVKVFTIAKYKESEVDLDFSFMKIQGQWKIYDIIIDEVSIVETYQETFKKILEKDNFKTLLQKMKNKLNE